MSGLATTSIQVTQNINISGNVAAAGLKSGSGNQVTDNLTHKFSTTVANAAAMGADEPASLVYSIAASGNQVVDLNSFLDLGGQTAAAIVRCKGYRIRLYAATESTPGGTAGTACSSITVGGGASDPTTLNLGGTTPTMTINNGSCATYSDGSAGGITGISGTACNLKILNNDSVNAAIVMISVWGGSS